MILIFFFLSVFWKNFFIWERIGLFNRSKYFVLEIKYDFCKFIILRDLLGGYLFFVIKFNNSFRVRFIFTFVRYGCGICITWFLEELFRVYR